VRRCDVSISDRRGGAGGVAFGERLKLRASLAWLLGLAFFGRLLAMLGLALLLSPFTGLLRSALRDCLALPGGLTFFCGFRSGLLLRSWLLALAFLPGLGLPCSSAPLPGCSGPPCSTVLPSLTGLPSPVPRV
jgi:hypothetical protein